MFRPALAPLAWYYAIAAAVPLLNGATLDAAFLEHVAFVFAVPLVLVATAGASGHIARRGLRARRDT